MNSQSHVVLIKNMGHCATHRDPKWEVRSVREVLNAAGGTSTYSHPLELAASNDQESVNALSYIARAMNTDRKTEKFWLRYAGMQVSSGRRLDYARQLTNLNLN